MSMREEEHLCMGAAVLLRDAQVSAERCTTADRIPRQLALQYPGPQENMEFSGIPGLRFPGAKHATTTKRRDTPATQCMSAPETTPWTCVGV